MTQTTTYAVTLDDVRVAARRIEPHIRLTRIMTCRTLDGFAGRELFFKCEPFQRTGSFKFRGACNAVLKLTDEEAARGVLTHSSGNYAQALALAATLRGAKAHIVMPRTAPPVKKRAVEGYGGIVHECEPTLVARETLAAELAEQTGAVLIPSYDHPDVIAGQGTATLEMLDQVSDLDAVIAPIGGGGLVSGTCIAAKGLQPGIRVFAAEPAGADDAARSMEAGELIPQTSPDTICDGLLTSLGQHTWPIIRDHVERIFTAEDPKIVEAMRLVWQRMKIIIEPSSAVVMAVMLSDEFMALEGLNRIGVILSGGNVSLRRLVW
jgi:threonine dehydratase/serine racemase